MVGGESRAASRLGVLGSQERRARLPRGAAAAGNPCGRRGYCCHSRRRAARRAAGAGLRAASRAPSGSLRERGGAAGEAAPPAGRGGGRACARLAARGAPGEG